MDIEKLVLELKKEYFYYNEDFIIKNEPSQENQKWSYEIEPISERFVKALREQGCDVNLDIK